MGKMTAGELKLGTRPVVAGVIVDSIDLSSIKKARSIGADLVEVRVDTFNRRDPEVISQGLKKIKAAGLPIILTIRSKIEGGRFIIKDDERLSLFSTLIPHSDLVDIELSSKKILKEVVGTAKRNKKRVIVSYHNFKATPRAGLLTNIIKKGRSSGADIVKVATNARKTQDIRTLARVLLGFKGIIAIAMGEKGTFSRVFFPALGSLITYGSITGSTAPGQLPVKTINDQFRLFGLR